MLPAPVLWFDSFDIPSPPRPPESILFRFFRRLILLPELCDVPEIFAPNSNGASAALVSGSLVFPVPWRRVRHEPLPLSLTRSAPYPVIGTATQIFNYLSPRSSPPPSFLSPRHLSCFAEENLRWKPLPPKQRIPFTRWRCASLCRSSN